VCIEHIAEVAYIHLGLEVTTVARRSLVEGQGWVLPNNVDQRGNGIVLAGSSGFSTWPGSQLLCGCRS
jgi:hypothetical protein